MKELGQYLKEARIQSGISIEEIERSTFVNKRFLQMLENGEADKIPTERAYVKAYIRSYCKAVGADTSTALGLYGDKAVTEMSYDESKTKAIIQGATERSGDRSRKSSATSVKVKKQREQGMGRGKLLNLLLVILLLIVVILLFRVAQSNEWFSPDTDVENPPIVDPGEEDNDDPDDDDEEPIEPVVPVPDPEPIPVITQDAEIARVITVDNIERIELQLSIADGENCWMSVQTDGEEVVQETLRGPLTMDFEAEENIRLHLGKPQTISLIINGEDIGALTGNNARVVNINISE